MTDLQASWALARPGCPRLAKIGCVAGALGFAALAAMFSLPLAVVAVVTAPLHSPMLIEPVICPEGSSLEVGWISDSGNASGEYTMSTKCVDARGDSVPSREMDGDALLDGLKIYYPIVFGILFIFLMVDFALPFGIIMVAVTLLARANSGRETS